MAYFSAKIVLDIDLKGNNPKKIESVDFNLAVSSDIDESSYLDEEGLPTELGTKMLTAVLAHGISGHIVAAHEKGHWKLGEHIQYVFDLITKASYDAGIRVEKSHFQDDDEDNF